VKLIAVGTDTSQQGNFVFTSLQEAVAKGRFQLDDIALAHRQGDDVHIDHTKGRLSRTFGSGIDDDRVKRVFAANPESVGYVFALGDENIVDAIARRVRTLTKGDMKTYDVEDASLIETIATDETYALSEDAGFTEGTDPFVLDVESTPGGPMY
jgi:hypothetical protein